MFATLAVKSSSLMLAPVALTELATPALAPSARKRTAGPARQRESPAPHVLSRRPPGSAPGAAGLRAAPSRPRVTGVRAQAVAATAGVRRPHHTPHASAGGCGALRGDAPLSLPRPHALTGSGG